MKLSSKGMCPRELPGEAKGCSRQTPKGPHFIHTFKQMGASLVALTVKNLPAMQEMQVQSLDQGGPMEKAMATHSSNLAWKIPWTEEPGRLQSMGSQRVGPS